MSSLCEDGEPESETDPFETEFGMGPDLYNYREPYRQFLASSREIQLPNPEEQAVLYQQAAACIAAADYLLVGAGAGMGVDSGLAAYRDVAAVSAWTHAGHDYSSLQILITN